MTQNIPKHKMDEVLPNRRRHAKSATALVIVMLAIGSVALDQYLSPTKVERSSIDTTVVEFGSFSENISVRGKINTVRTTLIDTSLGGIVHRIYVEDGQIVKQGELLVQLLNDELELRSLNTEAMIVEQINGIKDGRNFLNQRRITLRKEILDLEYSLETSSRNLKNEKMLEIRHFTSRAKIESLENEVDWLSAKLDLTHEAVASEMKTIKSQRLFYDESEQRFLQGLELVKRNLNALSVHAPMSGVISGLSLKLGQNLKVGESIGRIDQLDEVLVTANVGEYYISKIQVGQTARTVINQTLYSLVVSKIYPQIKNSEFTLEAKFTSLPPNNLKIGQALNLQIDIVDPVQKTFVAIGDYLREGNREWVYVVSPGKGEAKKRKVTFGRSGGNQIEVLEGLEAGETIVSSSYRDFIEESSIEIYGGRS